MFIKSVFFPLKLQVTMPINASLDSQTGNANIEPTDKHLDYLAN
jgi:hypothetical protein